MRYSIRIIISFISVLCFQLTAYSQLISKKESAAVEHLLTELSRDHKPGAYLIKDVNLLSMNSSEIMESMDVLIGNGIIKEVGKDLGAENAIVIDGTGKFLMPGLTDTHVHLFEKHPLKNIWTLWLLLQGVTTVRDMCGEPGKIALRERIKNNEWLAPNLYQSGPIINGTRDNTGLFATATKPAEGIAIVADQKKAGYDFIKVYDGLSKEVYEAIAGEAHRHGMLMDGHLPDQVSVEDAIRFGHNSIEHLTGYFEWKDNQVLATAPDSFASITASSNIWNCPTIYNHYLNGSREAAQETLVFAGASAMMSKDLIALWKKRANSNSKQVAEIVDRYGASNFETLRQIVLNLYKADAKLIAGTDSGNLPLLIPGYALHQELKLLNEIGIPIYDVLKTTTVNAALAMQKQSDFGTVEVGKRADLLLLNKNPLLDLGHLQDKDGLMIRGVWLSAAELEKIESQLKSIFK